MAITTEQEPFITHEAMKLMPTTVGVKQAIFKKINRKQLNIIKKPQIFIRNKAIRLMLTTIRLKQATSKEINRKRLNIIKKPQTVITNKAIQRTTKMLWKKSKSFSSSQ